MGSFLGRLRKQQSTPCSCRHRRLRAESLEKRLVLAPVAALPVSVILLGSPSSSVTPPDPCIQLNPQPILSELAQPGVANTPLSWQGHFTEQLREPSATAASSVATPAAWLVDVVYSLKELPVTTPGAMFDMKGTAREILTPLDASGNAISTAQTWVSTDKIDSRFTVAGNALLPTTTFKFTTDTAINQLLTPVAATALTTLQSWTSTIMSHATGTITETLASASPQAGQIKGSISLQNHIDATMSPAIPPGSMMPVPAPWQISADFKGSGDFSENLSPTATTTVVAGPTGILGLKGSLSETITPPGSTVTTTLNSLVVANVSFWTAPDPSPTLSR